MSLLPILVLLFVLMWLLVIRPQRKRQSDQQRMLEAMTPGVEVLTVGGVYGTLRGVDEEDVRLEIAPGVEIKVSRRAIASVATEEDSELDELERLQAQAEAEVKTGDASRV